MVYDFAGKAYTGDTPTRVPQDFIVLYRSGVFSAFQFMRSCGTTQIPHNPVSVVIILYITFDAACT